MIPSRFGRNGSRNPPASSPSVLAAPGQASNDQPSSQSVSTPTSKPRSIITVRRTPESPGRPLHTLAGTSTAQQQATVRKYPEASAGQSSPDARRVHRIPQKSAASNADIVMEPHSSPTWPRND